MNNMTNYITIANLPNYIKCSSYRHILPELNCYWSDLNCSFPFILAITGNIATPETFPYDKKEYRYTGNVIHYTRRYIPNHGLHGLEYYFMILEKVSTGERFAILKNVIRNGECY